MSFNTYPLTLTKSETYTVPTSNNEAVAKRRFREAFEEAKALKAQDPLDAEWVDLWGMDQ